MLCADEVTLFVEDICEGDFEKLLIKMYTDGKLNLADCGYRVVYEFDNGDDDCNDNCEEE